MKKNETNSTGSTQQARPKRKLELKMEVLQKRVFRAGTDANRYTTDDLTDVIPD